MRFIKMIMIMFMGVMLLGACHNEKKEAPKRGPIENLTHKTAQKAVKVIKTPIDKAKAAAKLEEQRAQKFEEANQK